MTEKNATPQDSHLIHQYGIMRNIRELNEGYTIELCHFAKTEYTTCDKKGSKIATFIKCDCGESLIKTY